MPGLIDRILFGHVFDTRTRDACDQSRAALERDVIPAPVQRDRKAAAKPDQEINVSQAPQQPCSKARQLDPAEFGDGAFSADRRHRAEVAIVERLRRMSFYSGSQDVRNILSLLLGNGRDTWQRLSIRPGGKGCVSDNEDVRETRNRQIPAYFHPSCAIGIDTKPCASRR